MPKKTDTTDSAGPELVEIDHTQVDDFSDLFEPDEGVPFRVELVRIEPETWQNVRIRGYLCDLEPGTTYSDVKKKYGGGRFRADKRNAGSGRYMAVRKFDISPWIPKIEKEDGQEATGTLSVIDQPRLDVGGVSVPINEVQKIKELVLWMRAVRTLLPEPPDFNTNLLGTFVELIKEKSAPASDPLELLTKLRGAVPEIFDRSVDGSNLYTLLQEAIRQTGSILAGGYSRQRRTTKLLKDKPQPTGGIDSGAPKTNQEGDEPMAQPELGLMAMLAEVINAFRLDPPKEPKRVVAMFDHVFAQNKEKRAEMNTLREVGLDIAENQLTEDFAEDASLREKFTIYYTEIFDLYTDPERETA